MRRELLAHLTKHTKRQFTINKGTNNNLANLKLKAKEILFQFMCLTGTDVSCTRVSHKISYKLTPVLLTSLVPKQEIERANAAILFFVFKK